MNRSVALALQKLESEECRAIYSDFRDHRGRALAQTLAERGTSPREHLESLRWRNGTEHPWCRRATVYVVTEVGSNEIFVCPRQFSARAQREPAWAAGLVLHEQLHALGLGENPPRSEDITRQVLARCGR